jgi:hypothetical protein
VCARRPLGPWAAHRCCRTVSLDSIRNRRSGATRRVAPGYVTDSSPRASPPEPVVRPRRRQSAHALRGPTRDRDRNPSGRPPCRRDDRPLRTRAPELRKPRHCRARRPRPAVRGRQPRASSRATSPSRAHRPVGVLAYGVLFGIRAGHDAFLSDGVQNVLGRPAMSFSAWADREARLLGRRAEFRLGRDRHLQRVRQRARELPARGDAELREHLAQMPLNRARVED